MWGLRRNLDIVFALTCASGVMFWWTPQCEELSVPLWICYVITFSMMGNASHLWVLKRPVWVWWHACFHTPGIMMSNLFLVYGLHRQRSRLATQCFSALAFFGLADLLFATCFLPIVLGLLWNRIHHVATLIGCIVGVLSALLVFGTGVHGEPGSFETLMQPCQLHATTFVAFVGLPICTSAATLFANTPFFIQGYKSEGLAGHGLAKEEPAADRKQR